jgi:hypothetical protein|tara:strand:- start:384 stop:536 length:153 start_codon:yes stop_codon:yes gene_type:complete
VSPDPAKTYRVLFVEDAFDQALLVKAYTRYWGRYQQCMEVEAFEVIKGKI